MNLADRLSSTVRSALVLTRLGRYFLVDLTIGCLKQVGLVLSPTVRVRPRWVHFDSELARASSRTLLGTLISLTPGTVTADLRGRRLSLHVLDAGSSDEVVQRIRNRFELPLKRLEEIWS